MPMTRAKFRCNKVEKIGDTCTVTFSAVADDSIPEDQRFHRYTPWGELRMSVTNPAVVFEVNASYYLDFTKVEPVEAAE